MQVTLPPELQSFVRAQIEAGEYASEDALISDAVRALRAEAKSHDQKLVELQAALDEGEAAYAAGDYVTVRSKEEMDALFAKYR